jgi:hypothetical protein
MSEELRMPIPIKACHKCHQAWTLDEWNDLELITEATDGIEQRRCSCGQVVSLDLVGLDELDLTAPVLAYQEDFPSSARPAAFMAALNAAAELDDRRRNVRRLALVAFVLLCALVLGLAAYGATQLVAG